ncbi:MAG: alpha/beta hydrolase [Bauldia sp.]|nr:alpha/beta hydrolase [Bauldia sp.]
MGDVREKRLKVGIGFLEREIAVLARPGGAPGLFWLGGYRSDMTGSKARAVDRYATAMGLACTRFDYSGHGRSGGDFVDGTISRWLDEARAIFATTTGPQIVIGSSMGGWLALLLARAERAAARSRIAGMILIAPAVDMTKSLMWDNMSKEQRGEIVAKGIIHRPPLRPGDDVLPITRRLIDDGEIHLFGGKLIETGCPVHILQGMEDEEVPYRHATALLERLASDDVVLTLIKDGDHRLSRPEDLERLQAALSAMIGEIGAG